MSAAFSINTINYGSDIIALYYFRGSEGLHELMPETDDNPDILLNFMKNSVIGKELVY